jgi:alginate O-acetyltransferase complex protein AlgI
VLFNSFAFLLVFLPASLFLYRLADPHPGLRVPCLLLLSFTFYGYWDPRFIALLAPSILLNWIAARFYAAHHRGEIVTVAIAANLAVLAVFKYSDFLARNAAAFGVSIPALNIALPLGISFFTFHHIMYLIDLRRGKAPQYPLASYALYICFFPQVLSGPLVRWSEVMDQFGRAAFAGGWERRCAAGVILIVVGLAQKCFLSDPLATIVNPIFDHAALAPDTDGAAWSAVLGFTFQIFFDFSAYSDIAIGTALLFGIRLPINFDAPYRASSIREFWRRWHMTLSRFLRDYLYIPLGGNQHGLAVQVSAILATMALGGLWHGAGWNFVAWGLLHGIAIATATVWSRWLPPLWAPVGWTLTFAFVAFSWILFRATSLDAAFNLLHGLAVSPIAANLPGTRTIAIAALCAAILPPTHAIAARLTKVPQRVVAAALALAAIAAITQIGRGENYEFLYFQF